MNEMTNPYWWEAAPPAALPPADLPAHAEIVIIGAGFTGLSAAITLARAGRDVVVIEKGKIGEAASARNGGITSGNLRYDYHQLCKKFGHDKADAIEAESFAARADLHRFITEENIDCDYHDCGRMVGLYSTDNQDNITAELARIEARYGVKGRYVAPSELSDYTASTHYTAGLFRDDIGGIHPAKLLHEMKRIALEAGAKIFTQTAITGMVRHGTDFMLVASNQIAAHHSVTAEHVIAATNAYTDRALPWLKRRLVPVISEIIVTEQLGRNQVRALMPKLSMFGEARRIGYYYRPTPDGNRILLGGRRLKHTDKAAKSLLHEGLAGLFPELADAQIDHYWSGFVAFPFDQTPKLAVHDGVIYPCGYCGSGTVWARWMGQKAAMMILGTDATSAFARMPMRSMPFYFGGFDSDSPWFARLAISYYRLRDMISPLKSG
ncbi:MAG: NAD(P)/FAD-dependent oxidoreductase [Candidatus Puniceispirillaceae bacterium]